jgi:hypothetical protein
MNKKSNIHHLRTRDDGTALYGIGVWSDRNAQYTAPVDKETRALTGWSAEFSRYPIGVYTLSQAQRRAKQLWGYAKKD